jgi:hypothetical protein
MKRPSTTTSKTTNHWHFRTKATLKWQGLDAQVLLLEDMEAGELKLLGEKELWGKRPEYYECFPLPAFRNYIYQEIRTGKYL